ncbi:MAG: hypothetical protein ACLFWM_10405 [Actinomycetota bacterium]
MTSPTSASIRRVLWTRGKGCRELAELLAGADAPRVQGDPVTSCVTERADLLVSRRIQPSFDLVDVAMPVDVDPEGVEAVVAAVAGGPHSVLAARVARRLGEALGVPASMVSAYPLEEGRRAAEEVVEQITPRVPEIEYRTMETAGMSDLVARLPERSLLVFGAPGGSWFRRHLAGPGARLRSHASAGAVVVRSAPRRVFQMMGEPVYVAPMLHVQDTLRIRTEDTLAVADGGRLVGLVRRSRLTGLRGDMPVGEAMEEPIAIGQLEPVEAARPLQPVFGVDPIPVVDGEERLVGGLTLPAA